MPDRRTCSRLEDGARRHLQLWQPPEDDRFQRDLQALDVSFVGADELHGLVPGPRSWLGDEIKDVAMAMLHRQAQAAPAQPIAIGDYPHGPGGMGVFMGVPSGTLQIRVLSSFTVSFSLPMILRRWCSAASALPRRYLFPETLPALSVSRGVPGVEAMPG